MAASPCAATVQDQDGLIPLHLAAKQGHKGVMQLILETCPLTARIPDNRGFIPLHLAANSHREEIVQMLGEAMYRARGMQLETLKAPCGGAQAPVKATPSAAVCTSGHRFPAESAPARNGRKMAVQSAYGARSGAMGSNNTLGCTSLHLAAQEGDAGAVSALVKAVPFAVLLKDDIGRSPLHYASEAGQEQAVETLVAASPAAAALKDVNGSSPLHLAANAGHEGTARIL
eukprot:scaffold375790_cov32-Prasinocladus_malaysianus.AAC.1